VAWYECMGVLMVALLTGLAVAAGNEKQAAEPADRRTLTVAVVQFAITPDVKANLEKMLGYIDEAKERRVDLVLFSECCLTGYGGAEIESTEQIDRDALAKAEAALRNAAKEAGLYIAYGTTTFRSEGKPYNSLVLVDDTGAERGRYHKVFVTPGDQKHYAGGDALVVEDVKGVKVALSICFDFRFPELYRWQAEQGAEVLLIAFHQSTEWGNPTLEQVGPAHLASRAAENNCFVVASNKGAAKQWFSSRIYAPDGTLMAAAPTDEEALLVQSLELSRRNAWNARIAEWGLRALRTGEVPCGSTLPPPRVPSKGR